MKIFREKTPDCEEKLLRFEKERFLRAPLIIIVVFSPKPEPKAPEWEQTLSCGAACQNILLAAHALKYGAQWLTEWYSYDEDFSRHLNLKSDEKICGVFYIGSYNEKPSERNRPDLLERINHY